MRAHWGKTLTLYAYFASVVGATVVISFNRKMAGGNADVLKTIVWQSLVYGFWLPVVLLSSIVLKPGLTFRSLLFVGALGALAVLSHDIFATLLDRQFALHPSRSFANAVIDRAPIDILMYTAIVAAVAAAAAHVRSTASERIPVSTGTRGNALTDQPLLVSVGSAQVPVQWPSVEFLAAAGNYVVVTFDQREGLVRGTLREFEKRLEGSTFARCHRSAIVNLAQITGATSIPDGSWRLETKTGNLVLLSRTYRDQVLARLGRNK